jgi:hypothetical protein
MMRASTLLFGQRLAHSEQRAVSQALSAWRLGSRQPVWTLIERVPLKHGADRNQLWQALDDWLDAGENQPLLMLDELGALLAAMIGSVGGGRGLGALEGWRPALLSGWLHYRQLSQSVISLATITDDEQVVDLLGPSLLQPSIVTGIVEASDRTDRPQVWARLTQLLAGRQTPLPALSIAVYQRLLDDSLIARELQAAITGTRMIPHGLDQAIRHDPAHHQLLLERYQHYNVTTLAAALEQLSADVWPTSSIPRPTFAGKDGPCQQLNQALEQCWQRRPDTNISLLDQHMQRLYQRLGADWLIAVIQTGPRRQLLTALGLEGQGHSWPLKLRRAIRSETGNPLAFSWSFQ